MRKFRHYVMLTLLVIITSCAETKQFAYFQDMSNDGVTPQVSMPVDIKAQVGDQLSININAQDDRLQKMFNLSMVSSGGSSNQTRLVYTVDSKGCITLPVLGAIKVLGLTREQIAALVSQELKARELLSDPVVVVQFQNAFVSVLGDVGNPGRINFDKDNMTIIDAIAQAGDLQATGKRARVFVLRQVNGKQQMYLGGWTVPSADATEAFAAFNSAYIGKGDNRSFYANDDVDALIETINTETDSEKRMQACVDLQKLLADECVTVGLYVGLACYSVNKDISNFVVLPSQSPNFAGITFAN